MKCPICGIITKDARVIDSRSIRNTIRRRRECEHCKGRWNTYEVLEEEYITERNKRRNIAWNEGEIHTLVKLYQEGLSRGEIALKLGRSHTSVSRKIDKLLANGVYFEVVKSVC